MVDIVEVSAIVAVVGVMIGVVYYILDIRHQARTRQTDLVDRLYSAFISREFFDAQMNFMALEFEDYEDYVKKYGPIFHIGKGGVTFKDTPEFRGILYIDNFFQEVGVLLHKGLIDAGLVREIFTYRIELLWKKMEPIILGYRKEFNQPEAGKWFEYLYNEMKKKEQQLASKTA